MTVTRSALALFVLLVAGAAAPAQEEPMEQQQAALVAPPQVETDRMVLNALGDLSVDALTGFRDRPLFTPSRQPPPPPYVEPPPAEPEPEPEPAAYDPTPPDVRLAGILAMGDASVALVQDLASGTTSSLRVGDAVGEWQIGAIDADSVRLVLGDRFHEMRLFQPGGAAAPAPANVSGGEAFGEDAAMMSDPPVDGPPPGAVAEPNGADTGAMQPPGPEMPMAGGDRSAGHGGLGAAPPHDDPME